MDWAVLNTGHCYSIRRQEWLTCITPHVAAILSLDLQSVMSIHWITIYVASSASCSDIKQEI